MFPLFCPTINGEDAGSEEWVRFGKGLVLTLADKEHILAGGKLDDRHINVAQNLLKQQFSEVAGLQSTLLQAKPRKLCDENRKMIQIVHSRCDHWIVAATMLSTDDRVLVYDSLYRTLDQPTENIISNSVSPAATITELVQVNRQTGGLDCGVFAVAISTALAFQQNPAVIKFDQPALRPHLVACFEKRQFSPFPSVYISYTDTAALPCHIYTPLPADLIIMCTDHLFTHYHFSYSVCLFE